MIDHKKAVIGIILNNPEMFEVAISVVDVDDFLIGSEVSDSMAGYVFSEMNQLNKNSLPVTRQYVTNGVIERFDSDYYKDVSFTDYIAECCKYFEGDLVKHARQVKNNSKQSRFMYALDVAKTMPNPEEYITQELEILNSNSDDKSKTFKDLIRSVVEHIDNIGGGISGLETGIPALDRITGGLQGGRLYTIAARPSVGKTAIANQIALNIAARKSSVGVCSLEMSDNELGLRSIAKTCYTSIQALENGDDVALGKMTQGMKSLSLADWPVYFNTDDDDLDAIVGQIRLWKIKHNIQLVVVDHIGLVDVKGEDLKRVEIGKATRRLKKLAKQLDIPIIITSQLNRSVTKMDREPNLSDLKESGNIEEDSDFVMFLHEKYNNNMYSNHVFIIAKNRQGKKGYAGVGFNFNGETQTFTEITSQSFADTYQPLYPQSKVAVPP